MYKRYTQNDILWIVNRIAGVIVSVLASNTIDRGFESRSGQTNDYKIGINLHLTPECCLKELALWKSNKTCWSSTTLSY